jgi:hypothetical protein
VRKSRLAVGIAGVAVAGAAFIGTGAGATFTTATTSSQKVTAGTLHVALSAPGATCANGDASGCHALTLPDVGPVGSTFDTAPTLVTIKNTGNIPAFFDSIQMSETHNADTASAALRNQMNVCIKSTDASGTWVEGNGPLTKAISLNPTVKENPVELQPGQTATYQFEFYAGKDSAGCGTTVSDGTNTRAAWGGTYTTPASLTNAAQGGVVTPTLTFAFTG